MKMTTAYALFVAGAALAVTGTAFAEGATGSIAGAADPGAQIIVTQVDGGAVIGAMAKPDGTYRVDGLKPGIYKIRENGPHHADRQLKVGPNAVGQVDLAPAKSQ